MHRWQFLRSSERRFLMSTFHPWFLQEASVSDLLVRGNDEQGKAPWLRGSAIFLGKLGNRLNQAVFSGQSVMFKTKSTEASGQITVCVLKKRKKVEEIIIIWKFNHLCPGSQKNKAKTKTYLHRILHHWSVNTVLIPHHLDHPFHQHHSSAVHVFFYSCQATQHPGSKKQQL